MADVRVRLRGSAVRPGRILHEQPTRRQADLPDPQVATPAPRTQHRRQPACRSQDLGAQKRRGSIHRPTFLSILFSFQEDHCSLEF